MKNLLFGVLVLVVGVLSAAEPAQPAQVVPSSRTPDGAVREATEWLHKTYGNTVVPTVRFFSLYNEETTGEMYDVAAQKSVTYSPIDETVMILIYTVNQLNRTQPPASLIPVNDRLFAIDLDTAGWTPGAWEKLGTQMTYFSPDWIRVDHWNYMATATQSNMPIVRADEFIAKSTVAPAYYDFLFGVDQVKTRTELLKVLGQDEQFVFNANLLRAGVASSNPTVTRHNRRLEYRPGPFWLWSSLDTLSNVGPENAHERLGVLPGKQHELQIAGQEHIFPLRWGGFGSYLNDAAGNRVDEVPITVAAGENNFPDGRVRAGRSCMGCHTVALRPFESDQYKLLKKKLVRLATVNPDEARKLQSVYDEIAVQDTLKDQQQSYERALKRLIHDKIDGQAVSRKFIHSWNHYAEERVSLDRAALDVGCTVEDCIAAILPTIDSTLLRMLPQDDIVTREEQELKILTDPNAGFLVDPGKTLIGSGVNPQPQPPVMPTIARDEWEYAYRKMMLLRGRPEFNPHVSDLPRTLTVPETATSARVLKVAKPANGQSVTTEVRFSDLAAPEVVQYNSDKKGLVTVGGGKPGVDGTLKTLTYPVTLTTSASGEFPTWVDFTIKGTQEVLRFEVKP